MAKKQVKNHVPSKRWELYEVKGDTVTRKRNTCPKCGPAMFMAQHKDRQTCGKCAYTEFGNKKE